MKTKVIHPFHQLILVFPLGLLSMSVLFDLIYFVTTNGRWCEVALWVMGIGILTGIFTAPFGSLDWLCTPRFTQTRRLGAVHALANIIVVVLFAFSWVLRLEDPHFPGLWAYLASFTGFAISLVSSWLGTEFATRLNLEFPTLPQERTS